MTDVIFYVPILFRILKLIRAEDVSCMSVISVLRLDAKNSKWYRSQAISITTVGWIHGDVVNRHWTQLVLLFRVKQVVS